MVKPSNADYLKIKRNIVKKLYAHDAFSGGHLLFERFQGSLPGHLRGFVKDVLDELLKAEIVVIYGKTKHGDAYQLNIKKLKEIEEIIG